MAGLSYKDFYDEVVKSKILVDKDQETLFKEKKEYDEHFKNLIKTIKENQL